MTGGSFENGEGEGSGDDEGCDGWCRCVLDDGTVGEDQDVVVVVGCKGARKYYMKVEGFHGIRMKTVKTMAMAVSEAEGNLDAAESSQWGGCGVYDGVGWRLGVQVADCAEAKRSVAVADPTKAIVATPSAEDENDLESTQLSDPGYCIVAAALAAGIPFACLEGTMTTPQVVV